MESKELLVLSDDAFAQTVSYLQKYIEKAHELRITVIGDNVFACKINSQQMDKNSGQVDWRQGLNCGLKHIEYVLPSSIANFCHTFLHKRHLNFGCFDFIVTPKGEYVFLECNPNGQWLWIEQETGMEISKCIANTLVMHDKKY